MPKHVYKNQLFGQKNLGRGGKSGRKLVLKMGWCFVTQNTYQNKICKQNIMFEEYIEFKKTIIFCYGR
jgi:hypothetical protein